MVKVSGFTIVRNAIKLDFPVEASIRSLLPVCDEVVVNVGRSEDETLGLVRAIGDPRIRIVETEWDMTRRNTVLGHETLRAMRECRHPWGIYIQADEVLHERGAEELAAAIQRHDGDPRVEGLLVRYLHFYGGFDTIATHRRWYRREVRAVRLDPALDIRPYQGAQGFRVGPGAPEDPRPAHDRRDVPLRLGAAGAGVAREAGARQDDVPLARCRRAASRCWTGCRGYDRSAPATPTSRASGSKPGDTTPIVSSPHGDSGWRFLRYYISGAIERMTGIRPFEFRNYTLV